MMKSFKKIVSLIIFIIILCVLIYTIYKGIPVLFDSCSSTLERLITMLMWFLIIAIYVLILIMLFKVLKGVKVNYIAHILSILILGILFFFTCTFGLDYAIGRNTSHKISQQNQTCINMAKKEIEKNLKAPSTAKFQKDDEIYVISSKGNFYVTLYVDAQNSFGAMIRQTFEVEVNLKTYETKITKIDGKLTD